MAKTRKNQNDMSAKANQKKASAFHKGRPVRYDTAANKKLGQGVPSPDVYGYAGGGLRVVNDEFLIRAGRATMRASNTNSRKARKFGNRSVGGL